MAKNARKCSAVWKYFDKVTSETAKCRICQLVVPRKFSNTTNMWTHIRRKHAEKYKELADADTKTPYHFARHFMNKPATNALVVKKIPPDIITSTDDTSTYYEVLAADALKDFDNDDETPKETQQNETKDAWKYFEKITQDQSTENMSGESDNENFYTEIVYLEDDQPQSLPSNSDSKLKVLKRKPEIKIKRDLTKRTPNAGYETVYTKSHREDEPKQDDSDEDIENFGRYVVGLLKKLPKHVCTQLQMDIINMIMTAKLKISVPVTDTVNINILNKDTAECSSSIIVTTPSNVIHTRRNNQSLPSLVIGDDKTS